jgi:small multidrug resistance pump
VGIVFLAIAIVLNAGGNFLLKLGADKGLSLSTQEGILGLFRDNVYLLAGVVLFGINVLFYAAALRALPLSVAYPVMLGSVFIIVGISAVVFLHEAITPWHIVGYGLVFSGVLLVSMLGS